MTESTDELKALCMSIYREQGFPLDMAQLEKFVSAAIRARLGAKPAAVPEGVVRAIRRARTAMSMWQNGYAFDEHGASRHIQEEIDAADALLAAAPEAPTWTTEQIEQIERDAAMLHSKIMPAPSAAPEAQPLRSIVVPKCAYCDNPPHNCNGKCVRSNVKTVRDMPFVPPAPKDDGGRG